MTAADEDVTRFAELLARLKARTDRSYAGLARRLDMNASTLHRYCAGETVPLDFAVVERFAALCGASPRERVELHRLWILAVAERRRNRPAATPPRRTSTGEPGTPEHVAKEADSSASEPDVPAHSAKDPGGTPEPGNTPAPLAAPPPPASAIPLATPARGASPAPSPPGTRTTSPGPDAANTAPAPLTSPGTSGGRAASRAWYRRRPTVVGSVLGTVFLLTAAGLSAFSALPGFPDALSQGSSGGSASPHHGPSASPSGSPGRPSAPAVPFTWTVNSHVWEGDCGHDYIIGKPPRQVPPPPSAEDAEVWANAQDAVHGGETIVRLSVQGRTSAAVVLESLHVRVVRRAAPPDGGAFVYDTSLGCGGGITPRSFAVNLDKHTPVARAMPGSRGDTILPARHLPYRVSVEDPEVLMVTARTEGCACDWYLDLDWSSQGSTGTIRIDDHGQPFRTAGIAGLPHYRYAGSPGRWVPEPPRD